jgi:hypothetical protein
MTTLVQEAFDRAHNNGLTISPALGTCVRYAKVAATAQNVASQRCVIWNLHLSDHEALKREKEARDSYYITYIPFVRIAIANALPNLRFLEWTDELTVSRSFFSNLTRSSIQQHPKLSIRVINEVFGLDTAALWPNGGWPLGNLYMDAAL